MSNVVFQGVSKRFPGIGGRDGVVAVRDLNLTVEQGTLVTLLGPSGCGKTTTLRMLAGFETPSEGTIRIGDADVTHVPINTRGIGMVFQSYALFPHMSVRQNVEYGLRATGLSKSVIAKRVNEVLGTMHLTNLADRPPAQLSGGQQQRVALARSVVIEPKVLLFDEPLSNLDAQLRERMRDELRALQLRLGITSLYVTHDQSEAMAISDRVVVMRNGIVEQDGSARDVYTRPATSFVAEFMGKANILYAEVEKVYGDTVVARLSGGVVPVRSSASITKPGDMIRCVVRPEHIAIDAAGDISAPVERIVYQGSHVEYTVKLDGQDCTVVDYEFYRHKATTTGEVLRLSFANAPVWLLPAA